MFCTSSSAVDADLKASDADVSIIAGFLGRLYLVLTVNCSLPALVAPSTSTRTHTSTSTAILPTRLTWRCGARNSSSRRRTSAERCISCNSLPRRCRRHPPPPLPQVQFSRIGDTFSFFFGAPIISPVAPFCLRIFTLFSCTCSRTNQNALVTIQSSMSKNVSSS